MNGSSTRFTLIEFECLSLPVLLSDGGLKWSYLCFWKCLMYKFMKFCIYDFLILEFQWCPISVKIFLLIFFFLNQCDDRCIIIALLKFVYHFKLFLSEQYDPWASCCMYIPVLDSTYFKIYHVTCTTTLYVLYCWML